MFTGSILASPRLERDEDINLCGRAIIMCMLDLKLRTAIAHFFCRCVCTYPLYINHALIRLSVHLISFCPDLSRVCVYVCVCVCVGGGGGSVIPKLINCFDQGTETNA